MQFCWMRARAEKGRWLTTPAHNHAEPHDIAASIAAARSERQSRQVHFGRQAANKAGWLTLHVLAVDFAYRFLTGRRRMGAQRREHVLRFPCTAMEWQEHHAGPGAPNGPRHRLGRRPGSGTVSADGPQGKPAGCPIREALPAAGRAGVS